MLRCEEIIVSQRCDEKATRKWIRENELSYCRPTDFFTRQPSCLRPPEASVVHVNLRFMKNNDAVDMCRCHENSYDDVYTDRSKSRVVTKFIIICCVALFLLSAEDLQTLSGIEKFNRKLTISPAVFRHTTRARVTGRLMWSMDFHRLRDIVTLETKQKLNPAYTSKVEFYSW